MFSRSDSDLDFNKPFSISISHFFIKDAMKILRRWCTKHKNMYFFLNNFSRSSKLRKTSVSELTRVCLLKSWNNFKLESPGKMYNLFYWQKFLFAHINIFLIFINFVIPPRVDLHLRPQKRHQFVSTQNIPKVVKCNLKVTTKTTLERNWLLFLERDLSHINLTRIDIWNEYFKSNRWLKQHIYHWEMESNR